MSAGSQNGHAGHAHLNEEWIRKYQSKSLAVEELQAAGRHLKDCGACRRVLLSRMGPARLPEELAEMPESLHLSYEQITAYIDGQLAGADKERAEAHTFICASCRREIKDLKKLDAQLAAPVAEAKPIVPKLSLWERMTQAFRVRGAMPKFGLAFGAIIAGIFLLFPGGRGGPSNPDLHHVASELHTGLHLGGYALVIGGAFYIVFRMWRR